MKKIGKLGLTIAMVLAMAIGTTATAFAAPTSATVTDTKTAISKTYTASQAGLLTETEFNYTLSYDKTTGAAQVGSNATATPQMNNADFTSKQVTVKVNKTDDLTKTGTMAYQKLFDGIVFTAPGEYTFTLSEIEGNNPNIAYDKSDYKVIVQVVWDTTNGNYDALTVSEIKVQKTGESGKKDTASFENTPNTDVGTLIVTKTVAGNAANTNDEFKFKVELTGVEGVYEVIVNGEKETYDTAKTGADDNVYTLKHDQELTIAGLPVGAGYTVTEVGDKQGYTVSDNSEDNTTDGIVSGTITNNTTSLAAFTNTKDAGVITGVFMDVLPYALIVVVAAAACFFFMTRRRNREDY